MKFNVLVALHVLLASTAHTQSKDTLLLDIPYNETNHRYYLETVDAPVTWEKAAEYCRENYGGGLAVLPEPHVIEPVMSRLTSVLGADDRAWIGGKRLNDVLQSTWYYLNSSTHPPSDTCSCMADGDCVYWMPGRPSIHVDSLSNKPCLDVLEYFLCAAESEIQTADNITIVNMTLVDGRYLYLMRLAGVEVSWYQARNICLDVGGDLAVGDVSSNLTFRTHSHWIGARRRRWQWIQNDATDMTFSRWGMNRDALTKSHTSGDYTYVGVNGWVAENDTTTLSKFVCEEFDATPYNTTTKAFEATSIDTTTLTPTSNNTSTDGSPDLMYIIIGGLCGGLVVLIVIVVVLVVCLRKAKTKTREETGDYQSRDFSFLNVGVSSVARSENPESSSDNYGYSDPADVRVQPSSSRTSPYATTSIEEVIKREKTDKQDRPSSKTAGNALRGLKKRLSWLMKRDYQEPADALPAVAMAPQGPDVVPYVNTRDVKETARNTLGYENVEIGDNFVTFGRQ